MSTSVSSVVQHFPDAENGFTTTTAGSVSSGAATVTLNSVAGYTNGEPVVLVIDPTDPAKKQTFTGIVDTGGVQITSVVWTAGTNQSHALGATVVDYATATHIAMMSKGIKVNHTQKGNHKTLTDDNANEWIEQGSTASAVNQVKITNAAVGTSPIISASGDDTNIGLTLTPKGTGNISMTSRSDGWITGLTAPTTVTANGNRSYDVVINSTDYTDRLSAGMRLRTTRTVAAPTQCTSLNGTNQYYSKSSPNKMTFTDDFTCMAWIKVTSYAAGTIVSRYDGTTGFIFQMDATGQISIIGLGTAGAADIGKSYQSVPLNKWVHVAASLDMSGTSALVYIDGVLVPSAYTNGAASALIQAGNFQVGAQNGASQPFPGKIAQAAVFSAVISASTIRSYISQGLSGSETNLASAYSFNNSIADLNTTTPNDLTAQGSAVATNADSPFGGQADGTISSTLDYAIITKTAFSTNTTLTVQVPEGGTIPTSGGVTALAYSTQSRPYGFVGDKGKWRLSSILRVNTNTTSNATYGAFSSAGYALTVPVGAWEVGHSHGAIAHNVTTAIYWNISPTALTGLTFDTGADVSPLAIKTVSSAAAEYASAGRQSAHYSLTSANTFVMYTLGSTASPSIQGRQSLSEIFAEFDLL